MYEHTVGKTLVYSRGWVREEDVALPMWSAKPEAVCANMVSKMFNFRELFVVP